MEVRLVPWVVLWSACSPPVDDEPTLGALRAGPVHRSAPDAGPVLVAFDRPLVAGDRDALAAAGLTPIQAVPGGWIVRGAPAAYAAVAQRPEVRGLAALSHDDPRRDLRVDPGLWAAGPAIAVAELAPGADPQAVAADLRARGLPVDGVGRRIVARLADDAQREAWLAAVAGRDDVVWVARRGRRVLLDEPTATLLQSGLGSPATPFFDEGLDGTGQIGALIDTGIDPNHCAFDDTVPPATDGTSVALGARKLVAVDFLLPTDDPADPFVWDTQGHGSLVAGIMAGDAEPYGVLDDYDGVAPGAKLVVQDGGFGIDDCADLEALGCPVVDLVPLFEQAYAQGARVHNNSWGDRENAVQTNTYSDGSADADEVSWAHPDYLLVFASGNEGAEQTVFSPSNAKNTLSVGATNPGGDADTLAYFTSGGPTADGRIKPDLVTPGLAYGPYNEPGQAGNCQATFAGGTSLASPAAAGLAMIVRQYFEDGWSPSGAPVEADGFAPSSALVKAVLIASAVEVDGSFASTGWGRPQLDLALPLAADGPRTLLALDEADTAAFVGGEAPFELSFSVVDPAESLRVVVVWRDPPGSPLASTQLVNDLDLGLETPGDVYLGNQLGGFWSAPGGSADRLNNVEVVRIEAPQAGAYRLEITPAQIALGPQPFAVVVSGAVSLEAPPAETGETGDTAAPTPTDPGTDPTETDGTDPTGADDTGAPKDEAEGCGCASPGPASGGGIAALLGLALARRRRR